MGGIAPKTHEGGITLQSPYDLVRAQSEDTGLYCLTYQQVAYLLSIIYAGKWPTRWFSLTDALIDEDWLDAFISDLETQLMTDRCQALTDKIDALQADVTEMEEDVDHIETLVTDVGTDITTINDNITTINNNIVTVNNTLVDVQNTLILVDNSITNITVQVNNTTIVNVVNTYFTFSSNAGDTTLTEMYARYNALCANILDWIYSEAYIIQAENGAATADLLTILGSITGAIGQVIPAIIFHGQSTYSTSDVQTAIEDSTAVNAVACYMVTYLAQLPMSFENFSAALAGFTPASYDETVLSDILAVALAYNDAFTAFVMNMQTEFEIALAANPTDFNCPPCNPSGFCSVPFTWQFDQLQLIPWTIYRGHLVEGVGIVGDPLAGDGTNVTYEIRITFPTPCTAILGHKFKITQRLLPTGAGNPCASQWYYLLAGVPTLYASGGFVPATGSWPTFTETSAGGGINVPAPPGGAGVYEIRFSGNTAYYGFGTAGLTANDIQAFKFVT